MFPTHQVQYQAQHQSDLYVQRIANQFRHIRQLIDEKGETVTLYLHGSGRVLTQVINRDHVTATDEPAGAELGQKFADLSYNESREALASNNFRFDVDEIDHHVSADHIETRLTPDAATRATVELEPQAPPPTTVTDSSGVPVANVSYSVMFKQWVLMEDCPYTTESGLKLTAKRGFMYDLASVPRYLWWLIAPFELGNEPPLFHDLLYRAGGTVTLPAGEVMPAQTVFKRKDADDIFLELMTRSQSVGYWKRMAAYYAVRGLATRYWTGPPDD